MLSGLRRANGSQTEGNWGDRFWADECRSCQVSVSLLLACVISKTRFGAISHKTETAESITIATVSEWYDTGMTPT
jgi:hypothetical protein